MRRSAGLQQFAAELRRRHVVRVAGIYVVVAWILVQAGATIFPLLHLPGWSATLLLVLLGFGFPVALVLAWAFELTPGGVVRAPAAAPAAPLPPAEQSSIAVLPFVNMSADPGQEYFSDGLTEEILNVLAQVPGLRVTARTSSFAFKGKRLPVDRIARQLRVRHVLEGSVRRSGDRMRITAQLIDAAGDHHLWSQTYDRECADIFAVQDEIARSIVHALRIRLTIEAEAPLAKCCTESVEAHHLYLRGLYFLNHPIPGNLHRAIDHFEQAVAADPDYAEAHAGLAHAYALLPVLGSFDAGEALRKGRAAADRAIALDPRLAAAYAARAMLYDHHAPHWEAWEREIRRAIELSPGYALAHSWYSIGLRVQGRLDEAGVHSRRALDLDPISLHNNAAHGVLLLVQDELAAAIDQLRRTLELDAGFPYAQEHLVYALLLAGRTEEAVESAGHLAPLEGHDPADLQRVVRAVAGEEDREAALAVLERWGAEPQPNGMRLAALYALLGESARALDWLEWCYQRRVFNVVDAAVEPQYRSLASEPRYAALRRKLGLPA